MRLHDLVSPINTDYPLVSGCGYYDCAVVAELVPFILVSKEGDMMWMVRDIRDFKVVGKASEAEIENAEKRLEIHK